MADFIECPRCGGAGVYRQKRNVLEKMLKKKPNYYCIDCMESVEIKKTTPKKQ